MLSHRYSVAGTDRTMNMRLPRDAGCVGLCSADMLARIGQTSFRRISPSKGSKGRVPLRVHDGGLRRLGGVLVEAGDREETRISGEGFRLRSKWMVGSRSKERKSRVRQGKMTARWLGWGWTGNGDGRWALGHVQGPPVTAQRGSSHFQAYS